MMSRPPPYDPQKFDNCRVSCELFASEEPKMNVDAEWALYSAYLFPQLIDEKRYLLSELQKKNPDQVPEIITMNMNIEPWADVGFSSVSLYSTPKQTQRQSEEGFLQSYVDMSMSYHPNASILATYYDRTRVPIINFPPNNQNQFEKFASKQIGACVFVSNCAFAPERAKYVEELAKYYPIRSFGKCWHNENTTKSKIETLHDDCKYSISFESHHLDYYITEKLLESLKAQTLSIYWGAYNIEDVLPLDILPVINANNLSPKQLSEKLKILDENPSEYINYFKKAAINQPNPEQKRKLDNFRLNSYDNKICSICTAIAEMKLARKIIKKDFKILPKGGNFKILPRDIDEYIIKNGTKFTSEEKKIIWEIYDHGYGRYWRKDNEKTNWNDPNYVMKKSKLTFPSYF